MKIVSFNEIIELNHIIVEKDLGLKLHLRDACGGQSFWLEKSASLTPNLELLYYELEQYFAHKNMSIEYFDDKMSFRII